jgi:hypothetical protein
VSEGTDFTEALRRLLDPVAEAGRHIDVWWRDDDAVEPSPALDTLLAAANRHAVPLALAVIPEPAVPALGERLANESDTIVVFQHGFAHRNHAPKGEKAAELGVHRPPAAVMAELGHGRVKLEDLFGARFLPVLTPPWNRIAADIAARRRAAGLLGLTTFARMHADDPACINTHVDIIDWKGGRCFAGYGKMLKVLEEEIGRRAGGAGKGDPEPLGLLTHHLDHDDGCRDFIDVFLSATAGHPAVRWPPLAELFGFR